MQLGITPANEGKYEQAIEGLNPAQSLYQRPSAQVETWLSYSYQNTGDLETALEHFSRAVAIDDNGKRPG